MAKLEFKKDFKYTNIGTVVGTLCYAKPLNRKDGSQYGVEFLLNIKGQGSINVRVPSLKRGEEIMEKFPVADRPHVRIPMVTTDCYLAQSGKIYINFTSFGEVKETDAEDTAKGNISGEVIKVIDKPGMFSVILAVFNVDKDGNLVIGNNGKPFEPKAIKIDVVDPELIEQFKAEVQVGSNITVGYSYINKNDVHYDEFGLPVGDGSRVTRIEAGKLIVLKGKKEPEPVIEEDEVDPFAFDFDADDLPF